jgi:hypothetical protein
MSYLSRLAGGGERTITSKRLFSFLDTEPICLLSVQKLSQGETR